MNDVHAMSANKCSYQYDMKGLRTAWRSLFTSYATSLFFPHNLAEFDATIRFFCCPFF